MQTTTHKIATLGLATATVLGLTAFQPAEAASMYTVTDLGSFDNDPVPIAINDTGQIVGSSGFVPFVEDGRAFLWENGLFSDLGNLANLEGFSSEAFDINDSGQIVGRSQVNSLDPFGNSFSPNHAFLWENGTMTDLNSLIPADSGWELFIANDINDVGQITGIGLINGTPRPVLLNPISDPTAVPEPLTILGSTTALGFGALFKREHLKRQKKTQPND